MLKINEIISRIKTFKTLKTDAEVAQLIGLTANNLSERKGRNSIPFEQLFSLSLENDVTLDWVLTGKGEKSATGPNANTHIKEASAPYETRKDREIAFEKVLIRQKGIFNLIAEIEKKYELKLGSFVVSLLAEIVSEYDIKEKDLYRLFFMLQLYGEDLKKSS